MRQLRIVFIGKNHPFSVLPLQELSSHQIVGLVESAPRGTTTGLLGRSRATVARARADIRDGSRLRRRALRLRVPFLSLERGEHAPLLSLLERTAPDIVCIASLSQLLPEEVLTQPPLGAINLHPSMLPRYRGPFPWFWQYHDFELDIGVTVHRLDVGEDTGPILAQRPMKLDMGIDIVDAMETAGRIGGTLMRESVAALAEGTAKPVPQEAGDLPRARRVGPDETFIDWSTWELEHVWHFMRGTYPWHAPVAYPRELAHARVGTMERVAHAHPPGALRQDDTGWFISHPDGKIRVRN